MGKGPIFIYGFIRSAVPENMGPIGIESQAVRVIPEGDISAVVSDSPFANFESIEKETLLRALTVYQAVIEKIMKRFEIIPMKFGITMDNEEKLRRLIVHNLRRIDRSLSEMQGRLELDVVAFWKDFDAVLKEQGQQEEIKRVTETASTGTAGTLQAVQIKVGKLVKESLEKKKTDISEHMLSTLKRKTHAHCLHSLMDDTMILNAAFLVDEKNEGAFEEAVKGLDDYFEDTINFRIVGPLPPYSFSTLTLKRVEGQEIEAARKVLGLGMHATQGEIRNAFWELSRAYHPDKFPGDEAAKKRFENIAKAYKLLNDYCKEGWCSFDGAEIQERIEVASMMN